MSPRPRKASDDDVFTAAARVMSRAGPKELSLADIAREAGVTAAALVQRFGSKRGLVLALSERVARSVPQLFARLRAKHNSPLETLRAYADCMAQMGESPGAMAHHLAYLQLDLTDEALHALTLVQARASRAGIRKLLHEARGAGLIMPATDVSALTRAVEVTLSGSLITWAFYREGTSSAWLRRDLDACLTPYLSSRATPANPRSSPRTGQSPGSPNRRR